MASWQRFGRPVIVPNIRHSSTVSDDTERAMTAPLIRDESLDDYFRTDDKIIKWGANAIWANIVLVVVFLCSIILVFCVSLHTGLGHDLQVASNSTLPAKLDHDYKPKTDFDVVVSMYKEDLAQLNDTISRILSIPGIPRNFRLLIYANDQNINLAQHEKSLPHVEILQLPNLGHGSATYLQHILTRWNDLARHTLFTEATILDLDRVLNRINTSFVPETGMLNTAPIVELCECNHCLNAPSSEVSAEAYELANGRKCEWLAVTSQGPFIASAARIRGAGSEVYQYLDHSIGKAARSNALQGMWSEIMQCGDLNAAKCWMKMGESDERTEEDLKDCQCFDDELKEDFAGFEK